MKQEVFEKKHAADWARFEQLLRTPRANDAHDLPILYRRICQHLALARSRLYSPPLIRHLNQLVLRGHQTLYGKASRRQGRIGIFFGVTFPQAVRNEWRLVLLSSMLFFAPMLVVGLAVQYEPELIYTLMEPAQVGSMERMYEPGQDRIGSERDSDSDILMFGYYIWNNTSIGFRTFASGLLFAVGTIFILLFNGLYIGAVAGHLSRIGYHETFWSFVAGHSALELTAIALSGAAGLKLGLALLSPGRRTRFEAVRMAARTSGPIIGGAAIMFFGAAFIEAFWSSMTWIPVEIKYGIGITFWLLMIAYFVFMGRQREA